MIVSRKHHILVYHQSICLIRVSALLTGCAGSLLCGSGLTNFGCDVHAGYTFLFAVPFFYFLIQAEDKYGITPLLTAIFEGHANCVKALLEKVGSLC